ncbi:non-heme iron oxygenase ferredoxin subunit [Novosphingobium sp. TH158]|uniref:Rieske (2Fe-2S) protein n=1 Tax=Novosphingobium sp. TH158 TaxID=2067455 RepID=UPI000C79F0A8|nr:non-heme iron oxygenase ferredoxin subunit [Novosphingobium sp. TH158]PLK26285.1 (2Fe-2S)-binding protein [Novosphingobium sp. TH158]
MSEPAYIPAASVADLPPGAKKAVTLNGQEVLLCHNGERVFAVSNICSHAEERLECGRMRGGWIACPIHGARFDLETGEAMNPPATLPIKTYPVRIAGDTIEIAI